jgi:hypothetical protein
LTSISSADRARLFIIFNVGTNKLWYDYARFAVERVSFCKSPNQTTQIKNQRASMAYSSRLSAFCDHVIEAGWLAALILAPLFFNVYSSRVFEPDKITIVRSLALVMAGAWIIKWLEERGRNPDQPNRVTWRTPLMLPTLFVITYRDCLSGRCACQHLRVVSTAAGLVLDVVIHRDLLDDRDESAAARAAGSLRDRGGNNQLAHRILRFDSACWQGSAAVGR